VLSNHRDLLFLHKITNPKASRLYENVCEGWAVLTSLKYLTFLVRSPGTDSHWTFVPHLRYQLSKHAQDTSSLMFLLHWLTVSQSTSSEHCTAPMLLRLINYYRFIIIIIIIIIIVTNCKFILKAHKNFVEWNFSSWIRVSLQKDRFPNLVIYYANHEYAW